MKMIHKVVAVAAISLLLVPAGAVAQSSTSKGYGGPNNKVLGLTEGNGESGNTPSPDNGSNDVRAADASKGSLPFTGADLGVIAIAGGALLAMGFGLRKFTHHRPTSV